MSVIVAMKEKDKIVIGCDSRESCGNIYRDDYERKPKAFVVKRKKDCIIGCAGNVSLGYILSTRISNLDKINEYTLFNTMLKLFDDYKSSPFANGESIEGALIVACEDKAYSISSNLVVSEITDFDAIGSGAEVALGAMYAMRHTVFKPLTKVFIAVETAGKLVPSVSTDVYITDTKELAFKKKIME